MENTREGGGSIDRVGDEEELKVEDNDRHGNFPFAKCWKEVDVCHLGVGQVRNQFLDG